MKTAAFILLSVLAAWWLLLTVFVTLTHRKRAREAKTPLTAQEKKDCRQLKARLPRYHMRPIELVVISPVVLVMLPLYVYGWLLADPYDKQLKKP